MAARTHDFIDITPSPRRPWARFCALLKTWAGRARQRRDLAELDSRLLRDVDISRDEAVQESSKPFWRG
jgi:uncharacterized protein YjiS (DUF1127 family)